MNLLDEIRSMREALARIEAGLIERPGLSSEVVIETLTGIGRTQSSEIDELEEKLSAARAELRVLRVELVVHQDHAERLEGIIKQERERHEADSKVMHRQLVRAYKEPVS